MQSDLGQTGASIGLLFSRGAVRCEAACVQFRHLKKAADENRSLLLFLVFLAGHAAALMNAALKSLYLARIISRKNDPDILRSLCATL